MEPVTLSTFLLAMPPVDRVPFLVEMQQTLSVAAGTVAYWRNTNIIPLYAQNYLLAKSPATTFDFQPFGKKQTRKSLTA